MFLVTLAMAVVAAVATNVFDRWVWSLGIAVVIPALAQLALRPLPFLLRFVGGLVGVLAAVAVIVAVEDGNAADLRGALLSGAQRLLTSEWPSPLRPDLVGAVALYLAIATALATAFAGQRRWHLLALLPVLAAFVAAVGLSAPNDLPLAWLIPLSLIGALFATLRPDTSLTERLSLLRGERRLIPLLLVAGGLAAAVSIPVSLDVRADPRRTEPAEQSETLIDPIEATLALNLLGDTTPLHRITVVDDDQAGPTLPRRWRTAALSDYDGQRWTPALTLRPIGERLAPDAADQLIADVTFLDDDLQLVPFPGAPIAVEADVTTDIDRTVVRLAQRPTGDQVVRIRADVAPTLTDAQVGGVATRSVDDSVSGLTEQAEQLAGEDGAVFDQLQRLERTMRDDWELERNVLGGGLQRSLIDRFIGETQRGNAEQFVTAYVLLARALGVDARVATGFVTDASSTNGELELTAADARIWPEVRLVSGGWAALDPVPESEASNAAPEPEQPSAQSPSAVQPQTELSSEDTTVDEETDETLDEQSDTTLSSIRVWAQRVGVVSGAIFLPIFLIVVVLLGIKRRRRRRRLKAAAAAARVSGAWAVATDRLVDAGLAIRASATNGDIAAQGQPLAGGAERDLRRLATLSNAVTFGAPARPDLLADDAASCLGRVESSMAKDRTRLQRLKWRLSLRSLRRSTRSPVTG